MKSYSQLESEIAQKMWQIWCPITPMPRIPAEFYLMAKAAILATNHEFDKMIADTIKHKLEKLYEEDADLRQ